MMTTSLHKIAIILNPASGPDLPVLAQLNRVLSESNLEWELLVTKRRDDGTRLAQQALSMQPDAIVVYGGDGTIAEVAATTHQTDTPLILLPGGTANVMVKELGVPTDLETALLQLQKPLQLKQIDMALVNGETPMCLRIEVGMMADAILSTDRPQKDALGPLAYPMVAMQKIREAQPAMYHLVLDGVEKEMEGVILMVANMGNIGLTGFSLQPDVRPDDGLLDVFVLTSADLGSLLAVGTSALTGAEKPPTLKHWKAKDVFVAVSSEQKALCDDHLLNVKEFRVTMSSNHLKVLV